MINAHLGELAALLTAIFWTVTALAFEAASKQIGSLAVNLLRLIAGFVFLCIFTFFYRGLALPVDADLRTWLWLILSGLVGFVFGDLCLFQAFVVIGARISMLIMALAPPITALISWIILGETMTFWNFIGMAVTIAGIAIVVLTRNGDEETRGLLRRLKFNFPVWGLLLAFGGAVGQATGLVLSKYGMKDFDPFASSQIRVMAGIAGFSVIVTVMKQWRELSKATRMLKPMMQLSTGAFFGPFLGVSFSLLAVQRANMGVAATLMAIVPVLIIAPSAILNKERVTVKEIIGALVAVTGVALLFI
jgi:drug/metabolite transporter (DMT)-like permease